MLLVNSMAVIVSRNPGLGDESSVYTCRIYSYPCVLLGGVCW